MKQNHRMPNIAEHMTQTSSYLIAAVMVLVPFHAFLTVWGSTFVGHFLWLRLWDEALLVILSVLVAVILWQDRRLAATLAHSRLVQLIAAFVAVNIIWGAASLGMHQVTLTALAYALVVNLRFFVWFIAVGVVARKSPWLAERWKGLVLIPLAAVVAFGLLQFFVWPPDVLKEFGYGPNTYVPYITLNQDSSIVRIQSTLRGANGLGAYAAVLLTVLATLLVSRRKVWKPWVIAAATALALVLTFSRSGWIAAATGIIIVIGARLWHRTSRAVVLSLAAALLVLGVVGLLALRTNSGAQDLVYHVSDHTTATQTSNEQHGVAFTQSVADVIHEPLGRGPGTSGQASWYNTGHPIRNTESLLLQIGEETGWLGLGLFVAILVELARELWTRRQSNLALALFASLVGITLISLVTYSWIDDTLAFIWWGLAGVALATLPKEKIGAH